MRPMDLIDNLPDDLEAFHGGRPLPFKEYCFHATDQLRFEWARRRASTPEQIAAYYRDCGQHYIGDLAWWHYAVEGRREWFEREVQVLGDLGAKRVLDWGAGIGSDSLYLAASGFEVTLLDYDTPALAFARFRRDRYGLPAEIVALPEQPTGSWDCVLLMDVLEHIPHYWELLERLRWQTWAFCLSAPFRDRQRPDDDLLHPQHLFDEVPSLPERLSGWGFTPREGMFWIDEERRPHAAE